VDSVSAIKSSRLVQASPFFYGWVVLAAGTMGIIMIGPSQTFTVGVFVDYMIRDLSISRSNMALTYGLATLTASFLLPVTGRLIDRHGARTIILITTLGLGVATIWMSWVSSIVAVFLGMLALRFFGFGSLQLVSNNVIAQWFIRRRGTVMGIAGLSLPIGLVIFPPLADQLINLFNWRGAWLGLGVLVLVVMLPVGWVLIKDRPEQYGLKPDGDQLRPQQNITNDGPEINWTLSEARQTGAFWIFAIGLSVMTMTLAGLIFHHISLFEVRNLPRETAVTAFHIIAIFAAISNLGVGRLLDKLPPHLLLALSMVILAATILLVQFMSTILTSYIYAALLGVVSGSFRVIDATVWPKYFGRLHLGSIKGTTLLGITGATSLGPYVLGAGQDYLGSYTPVLMALLIIPFLVFIVSFFVKHPEKQSSLSPE
jgi:MFS family permease